MNLFFKECRAISKSIIYFAFVIIAALFFFTQFDPITTIGENPIPKPDPNQSVQGYRNAEIPEQVMPQATALLAMEYLLNDAEYDQVQEGIRFIGGYFESHPDRYLFTGDGYTAYPYGFYKIVKLPPEKQKEIAEIVKNISGLTPEEIIDRIAENNLELPLPGINMIGVFGDEGNYTKAVPILVDYKTFNQEIERVRKLIGWGSCYSKTWMDYFGMEPLTYENRLEQYNEIIDDDKITNTYARYFCDYMGIVAALFAVFIPVSFLLRDRKAKVSELVYVRAVSSLKLIGLRYFASAFMCFLPILILSFWPLVQLAVFGTHQGIPVDYFAFIKYICAWVLPTILTVTGVAFILTLLTETPIAILAQMIWSMISLFTTATDGLAGESGFALMIRYNVVGGLSDVREQFDVLTANRIAYSVFGLILLLCSIVIFDLKRKGHLGIRRKSRAVQDGDGNGDAAYVSASIIDKDGI